jgi:DNA-binding transcriptional LysR family regulator
LDVAFVAGAPELPDYHARPIWTEPLVVALPENHRLAGRPEITWADTRLKTGSSFTIYRLIIKTAFPITTSMHYAWMETTYG